MLWVLKRTVSMRWFFEHPKHMFKLMSKEINTILGAQRILIWTYDSHLTLCRPETPKQLLRQTVKTLMKCCMQHFIRVCTILFATIKLIFREKNTIFFGNLTYDPSIYTMDNPYLAVSNFTIHWSTKGKVPLSLGLVHLLE